MKSEFNLVAIFGFSVFAICWGYLVWRRGVMGIAHGFHVLLTVAVCGGTLWLFQWAGGRAGLFAFIALLWIFVLYLSWRKHSARKINMKTKSATEAGKSEAKKKEKARSRKK